MKKAMHLRPNKDSDQICGIMKNNWLSVKEREVIGRQLAPSETKEDQEEQIERPSPEDEDNHKNSTICKII